MTVFLVGWQTVLLHNEIAYECLMWTQPEEALIDDFRGPSQLQKRHKSFAY